MYDSWISEIKKTTRDKLSWRKLSWRKLQFYWYIEAVYFKINPGIKKYDKNGKRSMGQLNYYLTFMYTICIYCTTTMAEVIFLTVRSEVMSLKRFYLRIYNYSVQITWKSKIPKQLTVINEYIWIFSWIYVTFVSCENVYGGSYKKMATPHLLVH